MIDFGFPILFLVMIAQVIIPPIPAEIIVIGASLTYGVIPTVLVAGSGLYIGSLLVFHFGSRIRSLFPRFWAHEKVDLVVRRLRQHGALLLWIRVLPYNPADVISYAAGIVRIDTRRFYIVTAVVCYVRVLLLALLGRVVSSVETFAFVTMILFFSAIIGYFVVLRHKSIYN